MRRTVLSLLLAASLTHGSGYATAAENGPAGFSKWFRNPFSRPKPAPAAGEAAAGLQADESTTSKSPSNNDELRGAPGKATPATDAPSTDAPTTDAPTTDAPTTDAPSTEAPNSEASASDGPTAPSPSVQSPVGDTSVVATPATISPAADSPLVDSAVGESRDEGMPESSGSPLGGAGPSRAENTITPVGRPRFGGGYFGGGYSGRAILAVPTRKPTASADTQVDEAPAPETPNNALPNATSPSSRDTPRTADPSSAASPDLAAIGEAVPRAESGKDANTEATTNPSPPTATVVPFAGRTGSSALTPIGVGVRVPETTSARPEFPDVRAEAEASVETPVAVPPGESPVAAALVETPEETPAETPMKVPPVEVPVENATPAVVTGGSVAEVVETGRDVQPVSGERETATTFGGRLFRRSPSGRASRATLGDDDGPSDTESPVPASGYLPPRRVAGGGSSRGPAATSPASTPVASRGPASWFAPKRPGTKPPTQPQPAPQQPGNKRSAAASQSTATKSSWMFWRSEPVETDAAPSRTASERADGVTVPPVITEPANSPGQGVVDQDAPARGQASAQGATVQSASAQTAPASRRTNERRSAARTPAATRASSPSRGTPPTRTVTTSSRAVATPEEGPSVEITVPTNDTAKPSISDRMRSIFGGKRD